MRRRSSAPVPPSCSANADPLTLERFLRDNPELRESLAGIDLFGLEDLLRRELRIPETSQDERLETLDRPRIHHLSGRAFFRGETLGDPSSR